LAQRKVGKGSARCKLVARNAEGGGANGHEDMGYLRSGEREIQKGGAGFVKRGGRKTASKNTTSDIDRSQGGEGGVGKNGRNCKSDLGKEQNGSKAWGGG